MDDCGAVVGEAQRMNKAVHDSIASQDGYTLDSTDKANSGTFGRPENEEENSLMLITSKDTAIDHGDSKATTVDEKQLEMRMVHKFN